MSIETVLDLISTTNRVPMELSIRASDFIDALIGSPDEDAILVADELRARAEIGAETFDICVHKLADTIEAFLKARQIYETARAQAAQAEVE